MNGLFFDPPIEANFIPWQLEEIYKTGLYNSLIPQNKEGSIVIDAGANIGLTSYYFSSRFEKVYAIEPSPRNKKVLDYMLEYNKIKNVKTFSFALSSKNGTSSFFHYNNRTMDSLYGNLQGQNVVHEGVEEVELKTLDTFMNEEKIDHVDLLKLDVEGVEFEILGSDSFAKAADKIKAITCEIHTFSGRNPFQIYDSLKMRGFKIEKIPHEADLIIARK